MRRELAPGYVHFKNPSDSLNLDSLYKATAYACLYKTQTRNHTRTISPDSITISLLRATYPAGLFKALKRDGYTWDNSHNGIFILSEGKHTLFRTQIIVINQLKRDEHRWIKALSDNLTTEDARELVSQIDELSSDEEKEHADAVLQVAIRANRAAFTQVKEEEKMFEALKELMADEIEEEVEKRVKNALSQTRIQGLQEGREEGRKEGREVGRKEGWREGRKEGREVGRKEGREVGRKEGIHGTILILSEIGMTKETIKEKIQAQYKLTAEQAQKYMLDDTVS